MSHEFIKYLKVYRKGSFLIVEGSNDKEFFCLLDGTVAIWKGDVNQQDKMVRVGGFTERETYFGEMGHLLQEVRTASIVAESDIVKVLKFPGEMLPEMIQRQPKLALKLCINLANRLKGTTQQQQNVTLQRNELRSDATDQLFHAKEFCQKLFMMMTAVQSQFQNPLMKMLLDYMNKDKLLQGGKKLRFEEALFRDIPPRLAELVKKTYDI
jgi:CRP-like cAMP-binding protein